MFLQLRRLTAREHVLSAVLLSFAITFVFLDLTMPRASRLRSEGEAWVASVLTALAIVLFPTALAVLLPRTGNESRIAFFRLVGRLPLLVRYLLVAASFVGLTAIVGRLAD